MPSSLTLTPLTISTCCQKPHPPPPTFGLISRFSQLELLWRPPTPTPPPNTPHRLFVFVFLLEFLICKTEKTRSYHSFVCCPDSLQRVAQGGGRATPRRAALHHAVPRYAVLWYAVLCMLNMVVIMKMHWSLEGIIRIQRRAPCAEAGPRLNVHRLSSH